jgi:carbon-monoxide dehydrogenase small subunit
MEIKIKLNGRTLETRIDADLLLIDLLRANGCYSVKRGCETSNCGLCTVLMDGKPILSCSMLAARADGHEITTLEGLQEEASEFIGYIADQGADQCGFCNPGLVMNTIALLRENPNPTDDEIRAYLAGNLCRCSGYDGQLRGIRGYLNSRGQKKEDSHGA